jgi:hypothetical protein
MKNMSYTRIYYEITLIVLFPLIVLLVACACSGENSADSSWNPVVGDEIIIIGPNIKKTVIIDHDFVSDVNGVKKIGGKIQNGDVSLVATYIVTENAPDGKVLCQVYPSNGVLLGRLMIPNGHAAKLMESLLEKRSGR